MNSKRLWMNGRRSFVPMGVQISHACLLYLKTEKMTCDKCEKQVSKHVSRHVSAMQTMILVLDGTFSVGRKIGWRMSSARFLRTGLPRFVAMSLLMMAFGAFFQLCMLEHRSCLPCAHVTWKASFRPIFAKKIRSWNFVKTFGGAAQKNWVPSKRNKWRIWQQEFSGLMHKTIVRRCGPRLWGCWTNLKTYLHAEAQIFAALGLQVLMVFLPGMRWNLILRLDFVTILLAVCFPNWKIRSNSDFASNWMTCCWKAAVCPWKVVTRPNYTMQRLSWATLFHAQDCRKVCVSCLVTVWMQKQGSCRFCTVFMRWMSTWFP